MAANKTPKGKRSAGSKGGQVSFDVEPGSRVQITVEAGKVKAGGKMPVTVYVEGVDEGKSARKVRTTANSARPWARLEALVNRLGSYDLATWLFVLALAIYLITRLVGLSRYPIYFFTDEAIQTQSIADLVTNGYRDIDKVLFPTFFRNGEYANLSTSVYLQWLPLFLFGKSALVTRATSAIVTLIAALSVGIILRDAFKTKYWWAGTLLLSITPSWFLHSRTAFETAEFTAFFAGTLCAYLLYRYKSPRYLYPAVFLAALAFYTYSPGQLIVPVTALALILSDWRYHWQNRVTALKATLLLVILALPYVRFQIQYPSSGFTHLYTLGSYLLADIPLSQKILNYFIEYLYGLSAWYWYTPNDRDLERHLMDHYGNIMVATLPFAILGLARVLRHLRESANRAVLIAILASPVAAALVQTGITRDLIFVIPAAIITALGLEFVMRWVVDPAGRMAELAKDAAPTSRRVFTGLLILLIGLAIAYYVPKTADQIVAVAVAALLALHISGLPGLLARRLVRTRSLTDFGSRLPSQTSLILTVFILLAGTNVYLLNDALTNGPLWSRDYGLGGMQYGAFQVFDVIKQYLADHPETRIVFSPSWANGTGVVARFFLNDPLPIELGSIEGHITQKLPLDDDMLFIMMPAEYDLAIKSAKFTDIHIERIFRYPDGSPGFYFVRLRYVDDIDDIFAAEKALRQALREAVVNIDGQDVKVRYSYLETDAIQLVFDHDPLSLTKTFEANPYVIQMTFPTPREFSGFSIVVGSVHAQLTVKCYASEGAEPITYKFEGQGSIDKPELSYDLPAPLQVKVLQVELFDPYSPPPAQIHIWELTLR